MKFNFDKTVNRFNTDSLKWDEMRKFYPNAKEDPIAMWVADMDFEVAPCIVDALHERVDHRIFGYSSEENMEYNKAIQKWMIDRHDWHVDHESVFFSPGVIPALGYLINLMTKPGDGIIIQQPVYYPFAYLTKGNDRKIVDNTLVCVDGDYKMDYDDLEEKLKDPNNKLMIFCSPHNPVGRVWSKEELAKMLDLCKKYDMPVISDEIHFDLTRVGVKHTVLETIDPSYKDKIVTCTAPSKTFNLAGLQNANIIINDKKLREDWLYFTRHVAHLDGHSTFGAVGNLAAYEKGAEWLDELKVYLDGNIEYLKTFFAEHMKELKVIDCQATYLVWVDFTGLGMTDEEIDKIMIEEAGVLLDTGTCFGEPGRGYQRFNIACPRETIEKALDSIKIAFNK
ncbi:pyridoxal phosphate-dependent aminotransferase [Acidaminobacter sp. JC074]|uniref:MalY/PatB family protein n=1 Tax=Acidaminobacter sp. JC074 TaxID=2530199 RepID=UPI001F0EF8C2|nr:MalY/PatB family protein [Acidaminobacter sp. JC074]MCH4887944.1 pyridoxal phosphate-dependent aminotransferase [Acidaminobacter sp. JC074]